MRGGHGEQGLTNAEIASELAVTPGTAKTHPANTQAKLSVRNRVGTAAWAPEPAEDPEAARPLLDSRPDHPAVLLDGALAMTAWNTAYTRLWPDPASLPPEPGSAILLFGAAAG